MEKAITLIGYMGSGKSTIGKMLAREKGISFVDLDKYIEEKSGRTIPEIFNADGEKEFRKIESKYLSEVLAEPDRVIALGGGTPCYLGNMEKIKEKSKSIYLKVGIETLSTRLLNSKNPRPLIKGKSEKELVDFIRIQLEEREFYYQQSDHIIESDRIIVDDLLRLTAV